MDLPLPFLAGREGMRVGLRSRLGALCLGVAGRGGAGVSHVRQFVQGIIQGPLLPQKVGYGCPELAIGRQKLLGYSPCEGLGSDLAV